MALGPGRTERATPRRSRAYDAAMAIRRRTTRTTPSEPDLAPAVVGPEAPAGWLDPTYGWPELPSLVGHLVRTGDPGPLHLSLEALPDADARALYTWASAEMAVAGPGLDRWVELAGTASTLPWVVRAARHVLDALVDAGVDRSPTVDGVTRGGFTHHLRAAEHDLRQAVDAAPNDPLPWSLLVLTGRCLEIPMEEVVARYERISQMGLSLGQADDHLLQALCAKAAGSHNHMFAFAGRVHEQAPLGSPRHRLIPAAHHEFARSLDEAARARYLNDATARRAITRAAARSVDQPGFGATWQELLTLNEFARTAWVFGLEDLERRCHLQIGRRYTPEPWLAHDRPVDTIRGRREVLGLEPD